MNRFDVLSGIVATTIILSAIGVIVGVILCIVFGIQVLTHPEIIGEFFGKIFQGFSAAAR